LSYLGQDLSIQGIMLGQKLKELREEHQFVQREVAAKLEVDTAYVSKMENGTKQVSRSWLPILSEMFDVEMYQLEVLWLADRVLQQVQGEAHAQSAMRLALKKLDSQAR
jgi:DNA phosphorothioation-dependent restriction protein DptG